MVADIKCPMGDRESFYVRQKCKCPSLEFYVKKKGLAQ